MISQYIGGRQSNWPVISPPAWIHQVTVVFSCHIEPLYCL